MKLKNIMICALLALAVLLMPCAMGEASEALKDLRLGDSEYVVTIPAGFQAGSLSDEDVEEGQVGYYYSGETPLDFDVYQFDKAPADITLADYAEEEAESYQGVADLDTDAAINDIPMAWYRAIEEYEGEEYETVTFIMESGDQFVEMVFWLDGDQAMAEMETIIETLRVEGVGTEPIIAETGDEDDISEEEGDIPEAEDDISEAEDDISEEEGDISEEEDDISEEEGDISEEEGEIPEEDDVEYLETPMEAGVSFDGFETGDAAEEADEYGEAEEDDTDDALKEILADIVRDIIESDGGESTPEEYVDAALESLDDELKAEIESVMGGEINLQLGDSPYSITISTEYSRGELTEEDIADDMVAYYEGESGAPDFDVYCFSKEGVNPDLTRYALEEAAEYEGVTEVMGNDMINDIPVAWYRAVEEYEGEIYVTRTYILDAGDAFVELVFWMEDGEDIDRVIEIMDTLREE